MHFDFLILDIVVSYSFIIVSPLLPAQSLMLHVALHVVVGHAQLELQTAPHILNTRVGTALGVDLAAEQLASLDPRHHVAGAAVDADVVAGAQLVGRGLWHVEVRVLETNERRDQLLEGCGVCWQLFDNCCLQSNRF